MQFYFRIVSFYVLFFFICSLSAESFDKVVIWGHKLHSHTHSYIHERFYRAFKYLGYDTYWFDNSDDVNDFDFSNSLFITEGCVDAGIPVRDDCHYILHNCDQQKYQKLINNAQFINMQVYVHDVATRPNLINLDKCIYYDLANKFVYMPWASDHLPYEIDEFKEKLKSIKKNNTVYWIGSYSGGFHGNQDQLAPFIKACSENGHPFGHSNPWIQGLDRQTCFELLSTSYMAPTITGGWQTEQGYIPCRIFITICSGQLGVTNSSSVYDLFDGKIVYNPDTYQLFYDAKERLKTWTFEEQLELMDFIKAKHTYLNRIQTLLDFFHLVKDQKSDS